MRSKIRNKGCARRTFLKMTGMAAMGGLALPASRAAEPLAGARKPNIVLIMADDLGYGDVGCYGATLVNTPRIDSLAETGMRFTDAHSPASVCTPTRWGLLTGCYPKCGNADANSPLIVPTDRATLPSLLKEAGYRTGCVGKWHLGFGGQDGPDWNGDLKPGPLEVGFDYYFGVPTSNNWPPFVFVENYRVYERQDDQIFKARKYPGHKELEGFGKIGKNTTRKEDEIGVKQTAKAVEFIKSCGNKPFFLYFPTCNVHHPHAPDKRFLGKSKAGVYGDFIEELDWTVGRVIDTLKDQGVLDNTMIIFTSDNGPELGSKWYYRGRRVEAHNPVGPLRGDKGSAYEGGHRVPFIVSWPGKTKPGTTNESLLCLTDMLATLSALAGVEVPDNAGLDSFNLLPEFLGTRDGTPIRDTFQHQRGAFRMGDWKLYKRELYNLRDDLGEKKNVYSRNPDVVRKIRAIMQQQKEAGRSSPFLSKGSALSTHKTLHTHVLQ